MFYRPPEFVVDAENPFANDKLKREPHIRNLTKLMKDSETPLVMTVSASWGSGKTSFIRMWKAYLRLEEGGGHSCIRFDAWQHDFNKEPLLAIMGELGEFISDNKSRFEKIKDSFDKAVVELPDLLQAMSGALTIASFVNPLAAAPAIACGTLGKAAGKITNYAKKGHSTLKKQLEEFKKNIQVVIDTITDNGKTPLYFFIDELDRCEPHYAIKLLEALKHFFDLNGIIFVLAIDRERLAGIVEKRYGKGVDDLGYLKRFVDVNYTIPEPPYEEFIEYIAFDTLNLNKYPIAADEYKKEFINTATKIAQDMSLKARDLEKALIKGMPILKQDLSLVYDNEITTEVRIGYNTRMPIWGNATLIDPVLKKCLKNFYSLPLTLLFLIEKHKVTLSKTKLHIKDMEAPRFWPLYALFNTHVHNPSTLSVWKSRVTDKANTFLEANTLITNTIYKSKWGADFFNFCLTAIMSYQESHDDIASLTEEKSTYFYSGFRISEISDRIYDSRQQENP